MKHLKPALVTVASLAGVVTTLLLNPSAPDLEVSAADRTQDDRNVSPAGSSASSAGHGISTGADSPPVTGTYTGSAYDTPYGPIQVQATVTDGTIADITFLQLPDRGSSGRTSGAAASALVDEALSTQSANVEAISGATWTVEGFDASLQSALDEAGL